MAGTDPKSSGNPVHRLPDWRMTLPLAAGLSALWSSDPERESVPLTCDAKRTMPDSWRRFAWCPKGRRQWDVATWPAIDRGDRAPPPKGSRDAGAAAGNTGTDPICALILGAASAEPRSIIQCGAGLSGSAFCIST